MSQTAFKELLKSKLADPKFRELYEQSKLDRQLNGALWKVRKTKTPPVHDPAKQSQYAREQVERMEKCQSAGDALKQFEEYVSSLGCTVEVHIVERSTRKKIAKIPCDTKELDKLDPLL